MFNPPATVDVAVVEVEMNDWNAMVEVEISPVPAAFTASSVEPENAVAPVPPLPVPRVPVTCEAMFIVPESVPRETQLFRIAKQPEAMVMPVACVEVAVPVCAKLRAARP